MKKILLTLATAFVALFAMAEDYPVVTSVEELATYPDSTLVLFQNLEVTIVEKDMGYYTQEIPYLSDLTTQIGGLHPMPASFTAVGFVHTASSWDNSTYREFQVDSLCSVHSFATLAELLNFGQNDDNRRAFLNSESVIAKSGTAIVSHIYNDYIFYYTLYENYGYTQPIYGVMSYPNAAEEFQIGNELTGYVEGGVFKGKYTPPFTEYDSEWNLIDYKGGCFAISEECMMWPENFGVSISYNSIALDELLQGYVTEAQTIRIPGGGNFTEEEGRYYYNTTYTAERYIEEEGGWVDIEIDAKIEVASNIIDLSQYVGTTCEDFIAGVWDRRNTGDTDRMLITEFISKVAKYQDIETFLRKGEQYEEEILTSFEVPLLVTYVYDDAKYKFIMTVTDGTNSLALDFEDAIVFDNEGEPTADYAALRNIKPGDMISGIQGYAQFYFHSTGPKLLCSIYDYDTRSATTFVPTVESSGNEVKALRTVTVAELIQEWENCQNGDIATYPTIANNVVSVIDVEIVETVNQWDNSVTYMVQGTDSMEISNLWGEDKMNFQLYERNNIVGIADFCLINTNYIYQLQPLSQEHITDASLIPEVENIEDLAEYAGVPVILKNAEITSVSDGRYTDYYLQDLETYANGLEACGKYDLKGIYETGEYGNTFTIVGVEKVHGFKGISDMDTYMTTYPDAAGQAYEVYGEVTVTYVDGENVFVQYMGTDNWGSAQLTGNLLMGVKATVKSGDIITGFKGISTPADAGHDEDWNYYFNSGARFAVAEDANITVVSSDNAINYGQSVDLNYITDHNAGYYSANAIKLFGGGTITKENDAYYYTVTFVDEKEGSSRTDKIEVVSNMVNLDDYVDQTLAADVLILGVYDAGNTTDDARRFLIIDFASTILEYQNIAEFIEAGENYDNSLVSYFVNPVTVTYVYSGSYSTYLFVQDETGALRVDFYEAESVANLKVGDQITGLKGISSYSSWMNLFYLSAQDKNWNDYTFEASGTATPVAKEATIPALNQEFYDARNNGIPATLYSSNLIVLKNVSLTTTTNEYDEEVPCLVDEDNNTLIVPKTFAEGYTTYEKMNITGIADYAGINPNSILTIHPRSQEDINDALGVNGVQIEGGIYLDAANQVVANGAVAVVVYDLNGRTVAAADAATVDANGLAQGVYVVRATYTDGNIATAKVVR